MKTQISKFSHSTEAVEKMVKVLRQRGHYAQANQRDTVVIQHFEVLMRRVRQNAEMWERIATANNDPEMRTSCVERCWDDFAGLTEIWEEKINPDL